MNIKVVEYTYPIIVLSVIYLICDCRDLRHTNNLQDVALDELTKSLPLLVRTNIDSYHDNKNSNKIETESGNLNHKSVYNEDDDLNRATMNGDIVHHDETKRENSMHVNDSVSRKASHINYGKNRYGRDTSMIPTYDNRKSFDAAHRTKNNKKKTIKEIWAKQNIFPNKSRKAMDQKPTGGDSWKKLKHKQKQALQERKDQLKRNMKSRKLYNDNLSTTIRRLENNSKSGKGSQKKLTEGIEKIYVVEKRLLENYMNKTTVSRTSCVLTKAEVIIPLCDNEYDDCIKWSFDGYCTNSTIMSNEDGTYKDWMIDNCRKSCDACPPPLPLFDSQIQYKEYDNNASTFDLQLNLTTDRFAYETSWTFLSQNTEDSIIFDSSEVKTTSQLESNAEYKFNYYCTVPPTTENQQTDDKTSTCYNFEVHDSYGDGAGAGFFSLSLNSMNNKTFDVSNEFEDGSVMSTTFCLDHDDGDIESEGKFIIDGKDEISEELNEITDTHIYHTSCVVTKAEIISCDDDSSSCGFRASVGDCLKPDEKDWMDENCQKSCDTCPTLPSLQNQIQHEEIEYIISTFNLSLNMNTDSYANDTLWVLFQKDGKNSSIFNSSDSNTTSKLVNNEHHVIQYDCIISQKQEHKDKVLNDDETEISTCYDFEVHDSFGDGICCKYGDGFFSMNVTTESTALQISDVFESFSVIKTSFCINHDDGEIENKGTSIIKKEPSHYPFRWQCKNQPCLCDSNPSLTNNIHENRIFLFEVVMLSDSDELRDVESAQYKAACWVLYDDPYEYYDLAIDRVHKKMIQRYILAVFYFTTLPEKWEEHSDFLSSRSECDWNYIDDYDYDYYYQRGISCDEDGNIIEIILYKNNFDGTIVDELTGLRMLEYLNLRWNNIKGTIPSVLNRLSELRVLDLSANELEGTIPPSLYNVTNLEKLFLGSNRLEGTIPETIGNLQQLSDLDLGGNNLSGSIPDSIYSLKKLESLYLSGNKLSSSISRLIGNLNKLEWLSLENNMLTGQIPSTIGSLSLLRMLSLDNNRISGSIPESLFDINSIEFLYIHNNSVTGSVPDDICNQYSLIEADCRNDVFDTEVSCNCCICQDVTPIWDSECPDTTIKVVIDHGDSYFISGSNLKWSLTNDATGKKVLHDGPYSGVFGLESYEACVAYSDCFSFNQISPSSDDENYHIYLNNNSIHNGTFLGYDWNDDINKDDPPLTLLSFQYNNAMNEKTESGFTSCKKVQHKCGTHNKPFDLQPNTTKYAMYSQVTKISSTEIVKDPSSPQSRALCWLLQNHTYFEIHNNFETKVIQKYVFTLLHLSSSYPIFGSDEYPPLSNECQWQGLKCKADSDIVTEISLEGNQTIDGTLLQEFGSLTFLEKLDFSHSKVNGLIPRVFSNLWSLKELNLSGNKISGTMPTTLFRQLNKLEHIDLSDNSLSGSINGDIGSYSRIRSLSLGKNLLIGSLPLDRFKYNDLEHLEISENKLSGLDLSLLLNYKNLKSLDISSNFFVGSLLDYTFTSLPQLRYFNISQNDISGTIPSTFPKLSNITHFDLHANKLKGSIPLGITEVRSIQHLNLQDNKLTGSLSSELNQLKSLNTLALSHNELKGSIPFDQKNLENIKRLHLQNNKLEGEAPQFSNITSYITDCGFPSDSLEPVSCSSCNTCCNSDGGCQSKSSEELSQIYLTLIFMSTIVGFIIACYALKDRITSNKYLDSFFEEKVKNWNALMLISDKSVYHFLLIDNKTEWYVAIVCGIFQTATLFLFVHSADMVNDTSDREYFVLCPANSLECEDLKKVSPYGIFIFGLILTIWLLRDVIGSVKLMLVSFKKRNIDFFFTSAVVFSVTMLSLWTSIIYIDAIAAKNTDMIKDAVVLLFVVEIDERIFQLAESVNPDWVHAIDRNMRNSLVYEGKNLIIGSWMKKYSESFTSVSNMIRRRNEEPPQVVVEDEDEIARRGSDLSEGFHVLAGESTESSP